MADKCAVVGKDNKEDKTREEADMTPSPFFPKSSKVVQKCPRVVQIHISSVLDPNPPFGSHHLGMVMGVMILIQISKGLFRKIGEE